MNTINNPISIRSFVPLYLEYCEYRKELDPKTLKAYRIDLRQFFDFLHVDVPGKAEIERYITYLHKTFKQKTVKRKIASVKAFYNYLEQEEIFEENPLRKIRVKFKEQMTLPRIIPRRDIEKLLNSMYRYLKTVRVAERKGALRDLAVVELCFATGARVYEISNLREENVDLESGVLKFMGKGGKERYIQIGSKALVKFLKKYCREHEESIRRSGFFFVNENGERYREQSIRRMLRKYTERAGIRRKITPHMFRHSFATYLIEEGVDISCVQQLLGHSSIRTTQIYIHVATQKQAAVSRISSTSTSGRICPSRNTNPISRGGTGKGSGISESVPSSRSGRTNSRMTPAIPRPMRAKSMSRSMDVVSRIFSGKSVCSFR